MLKPQLSSCTLADVLAFKSQQAQKGDGIAKGSVVCLEHDMTVSQALKASISLQRWG